MKVKLETFLKEIIEKTTCNNQHPVLTSSKTGLYLQSDYFNKQVASKDNTGYKVIRRGQFTYRAMSDTGEFFPNMLECADVGIVSPAYPVFEITQPDAVAPEYLKYFFKSDSFQYSISSFAQGSTRTSIKFNKLKTVDINLPNIEKQREIVFILDKASKLLELRKEELTKLDELIKARFVEMFGDPVRNPKGWDTYQLDDCLERIDSGKSFVCSDKSRQGNWPAVLKLSSATYGDYRPAENKALLDEHQFIESAEVHSGDLLFTRKNTPELVGMAAYVQSTPEKLMMPDLIFRLVANERMNPVFLWQLINCKEFRPIIQGVSGGSAKSMSNISKERLGKINVVCPPRQLQDQLVPFMAQVDKSKVAVQRSLCETQMLFDSLMQQYFS